MASIKKTRNDNWYAVHSNTGKILKGQQQGGYSSAQKAREVAAQIATDKGNHEVSPSDIGRYDE